MSVAPELDAARFAVPRASLRRFAQKAADVFNGAASALRRAALAPPAPRVRAFVSLGSNLGEREVLLRGAIAALRGTRAVYDVAVSPIYETDPVGPGEQGPYLNAVARLDTALTPEALLARLLAIERTAGRERGPERNAPRTLDLDLLLYGDRCIETPDLEVPHPRMCERPFVLEPLCDLAPELVHPVTRVRIEDLARKVHDPAAVRRRDMRGDPWRSRQ